MMLSPKTLSLTGYHKIGEHPLEEFEWDPATGIATLTYETRVRDFETGKLRPFVVECSSCQPSNEKHAGWADNSDVASFRYEGKPFPVRDTLTGIVT